MTFPGSAESIKTWVEALDPEDFMPPWTTPSYAQKIITERIEPWATEYDELAREHPDYYVCPHCDCDGGVDPEFYQPTQKLIDLETRMDALRDKGFRMVRNPAYDAERAEAWWERQPKPFDQTTITVGQSYHPEADA